MTANGTAYGLDTPRGDDWRHAAACRDTDPELHFPVGTTGPALTQIEQAKDVCRRCTVSEECLAWALTNAEYGVWGGMTEDERKAERRKQGLRINRTVHA